MEKLSWGIVSTAKEPTPLLMAFVAHYLHIGASEIHIFLDTPDPEFQQRAAQKPGVHVTLCDDAHWRSVPGGTRPNDNRERQTVNANLAYGRCGVDWLLHADIDEFLIRQDQVTDFLASRPQDVLAVSVVAAERVYLRGVKPKSVLSGLYRKPFDPGKEAEIAAIYGPEGRFLVRGLSGHSSNKTFYRVGKGLTLGLHQPRPRNTWLNSPQLELFPRIGLLHFDSYTEAHWTSKMLAWIEGGTVRRGLNPGRTALIAAIFEHRDDSAALSRLYNATRNLTPGQTVRLAARQKLLPYRFSIDAALASVWPGIEVDLSHASIDLDMERMRAMEQAA